MATERDELVAVVVKAIDVHAPSDWYTDDDHSTEHDIADAILAAGFRRLVPEGSILVSREDAQMVVYSSQVSVRHFAEARARIIAALKADAIEQEAGDATIIRAEQQEG